VNSGACRENFPGFMVIAKGDFQKAVGHFKEQLERLRRIYPVKTICMHGSPMSRHCERDLWERYSYRDFGIIRR
jgi:uncharacterized protein (UPF0276 family)